MKKVDMWMPALLAVGLAVLAACPSTSPPAGAKLPPPRDVGDPLVAKGRELFFKETFGGNGRTCGTCHRAEHNLTIDPAFIATLPKDDPLFVAEFVPELARNFENPKLMRELGLILENLDGFSDLDRKFTLRGVPHVFAQRVSIDSNPQDRFECFSATRCPHTGWSGDGAPGTRDLRAFAVGAVTQHFTKSLNRRAGVDFRLPTEAELDALEAYQLSEGRQVELQLPLPLKSAVALRGQALFDSPTKGKCFFCHFNAGANAAPGGPLGEGNLNFDTGVEKLPDHPAALGGTPTPPDDGLGNPGNGTFNTPSLVEAADTGPFFHNNAVATIEAAVDFYDGDTFNNSPAGQGLARATGGPIRLDATEVSAIAAFLRVINALSNIDELQGMLGAVERNERTDGEHPQDIVHRAVNDIDDAIRVLNEAGLHPDAVVDLREARELTIEADRHPAQRMDLARRALKAVNRARGHLSG